MSAHRKDPATDIAGLEARVRELEAALAERARGNTDDYRELFERSADAILIIGGDRFIACNDATVAMLRYDTREELLQTHPSELSPDFQPDGRRSYEKANEMMRIAFERGSHRFEWDHRRADGEVFPVEVLLTAVPRGDGHVLHVVWRDITERKRLATELRHAQKMEAVGLLAGGIAHDFNNLLMAIGGNAELLESALADRAELAEYVAEIRRASDRAAALVRQLLAFGRKGLRQPRVVDLNEIVGGLEKILSRLLAEDIGISTHPAGHPVPVVADPGQLEQVVLNLATNARDAMPDGGSLRFETGVTTRDGAPDRDAPLLPPGRYAVLTVSDTGVGITPENVHRVFDPFFTTKEPGQGTGLGLSTVYGIVKQSGGDVTVASAPDRGAVFRVYLPLSAEDPVEVAPAAAVPRERTAGHERILLVEDEDTLIRLVEKVLASSGYEVFCAADGQDALTLVETRGLEFDLLVTDVVMPRMGGPELARRLGAFRPDLKTLYLSGYTDSILVQRGLVAGDVDLVQKPFAPDVLLLKVREILDRV